jgi:uncharacterized protein (TIGR04255 family)
MHGGNVMPLPAYERVRFAKPPLRLVVAQVTFPLLFRFNEKPFLASFQEAIQPEYPRATQEQQIALAVTAKGVEQGGAVLWRFGDRSGRWAAVLGETSLTLEARAYGSIEEFVGRFERVLGAAVKHLGIGDRLRLGFRYVNEFRAVGAETLSDWASLLNPAFVGFAGAGLLEGTVEQAFAQFQSKRDDGTVMVRHGLLAGTTVPLLPADPPTDLGRFYLLDVDYADNREGPLDVAGTAAQLRSYHEKIYQLFRWSLDGGRLYESLEPRPC